MKLINESIWLFIIVVRSSGISFLSAYLQTGQVCFSFNHSSNDFNDQFPEKRTDVVINLMGETERIPFMISIWTPFLLLSIICLIGLIRVNEK